MPGDTPAPGDTELTHAWGGREVTRCGLPVVRLRMESTYQPITCGRCHWGEGRSTKEQGR